MREVLRLAEIQDVELVFEQSLVAGCCSSVDDHLHLRDHHSCMGCSLRGYEALLKVELSPLAGRKVEEVGFVGDDELIWIGGGVLASDTAPPKRTAFVGETMVKVCPNRGLGVSPVVLTLSAERLFI